MGAKYSKKQADPTSGAASSYHQSEAGGFHLIEVHAASVGGTAGFIALLVVLIMAAFACYRCFKRRWQRQAAIAAVSGAPVPYDAGAAIQLRGRSEPPAYDCVRLATLPRAPARGRDASRGERPDYIGIRVPEEGDTTSRAVSPRI